MQVREKHNVGRGMCCWSPSDRRNIWLGLSGVGSAVMTSRNYGWQGCVRVDKGTPPECPFPKLQSSSLNIIYGQTDRPWQNAHPRHFSLLIEMMISQSSATSAFRVFLSG